MVWSWAQQCGVCAVGLLISVLSQGVWHTPIITAFGGGRGRRLSSSRPALSTEISSPIGTWGKGDSERAVCLPEVTQHAEMESQAPEEGTMVD